MGKMLNLKVESRLNDTNLVFQSIHPDDRNGTGLGLILIICKDFVDKPGGLIWAESKVGTETTFYFTLPSTNN